MASSIWATSLLCRKLHGPAQPNITTAEKLEVQFVSPIKGLHTPANQSKLSLQGWDTAGASFL
jgi:hypothetical protein